VTGAGRARFSGLSRPIAAALCVLALAAVLISARAVLGGRRDVAGAAVVPGLAAMTNQQLAELLPRQGDFPAAWIVNDAKKPTDMFGYFRYHVSDDGLGFSPAECFAVFGVSSTGAYDAAEVFGHDQADPEEASNPRDVHLMVAREFDTVGFNSLVGVVTRCSRFTSATAGSYAVRILEDSHGGAGPQRFRYSVTTTLGAEPAPVTRTDYFSFARQSGLILSGSASTDHQQIFDSLFDNTIRRISAR
jgi:hypothetical protein